MALLNIGKKKGDASKDITEPPADVPDELPPLPELAPKGSLGKDEVKKENPQELVEKLIPTRAVLATPKDVPAELPALDLPLSPGPIATSPRESSISSSQAAMDANLFFAQLSQKIANAENLDDIRKSLDDHIVGKLEQSYKEASRKHDLSILQSEVAQHLDPLRQLESQWGVLKNDIKAKNRQMQLIEEKIREHTQSLKQVLDRAISLQHSS